MSRVSGVGSRGWCDVRDGECTGLVGRKSGNNLENRSERFVWGYLSSASVRVPVLCIIYIKRI